MIFVSVFSGWVASEDDSCLTLDLCSMTDIKSVLIIKGKTLKQSHFKLYNLAHKILWYYVTHDQTTSLESEI